MLTETETIRQILASCRTVAVVGLSPKPDRASHEVAHYLQVHGWRIIPVNPVAAATGATILGEPVYATLQEAAQHASIDVVDVFRNSEDVPPVAQEAIAIGARALWLQLGIENAPAAAAAQAAGLWVVQNRCLKVEHANNA